MKLTALLILVTIYREEDTEGLNGSEIEENTPTDLKISDSISLYHFLVRMRSNNVKITR